MNKEQLRKRIVYEVMTDLKSTPAFLSIELRIIRKSLNKNITKVLGETDAN